MVNSDLNKICTFYKNFCNSKWNVFLKKNGLGLAVACWLPDKQILPPLGRSYESDFLKGYP